VGTCAHAHITARLESARSPGQLDVRAAWAPHTTYGGMLSGATHNRATWRRVSRESEQAQLSAGPAPLSAHLCRRTMHPKECPKEGSSRSFARRTACNVSAGLSAVLQQEHVPWYTRREGRAAVVLSCECDDGLAMKFRQLVAAALGTSEQRGRRGRLGRGRGLRCSVVRE